MASKSERELIAGALRKWLTLPLLIFNGTLLVYYVVAFPWFLPVEAGRFFDTINAYFAIASFVLVALFLLFGHGSRYAQIQVQYPLLVATAFPAALLIISLLKETIYRYLGSNMPIYEHSLLNVAGIAVGVALVTYVQLKVMTPEVARKATVLQYFAYVTGGLSATNLVVFANDMRAVYIFDLPPDGTAFLLAGPGVALAGAFFFWHIGWSERPYSLRLSAGLILFSLCGLTFYAMLLALSPALMLLPDHIALFVATISTIGTSALIVWFDLKTRIALALYVAVQLTLWGRGALNKIDPTPFGAVAAMFVENWHFLVQGANFVVGAVLAAAAVTIILKWVGGRQPPTPSGR